MVDNSVSFAEWEKTDRELQKARAEIERLRADAQHAIRWLRGQANAEQEPKAKAAFVEAANAVLGIIEHRFDEQQGCPDHPTGRTVDADGKQICSTCGR